MSSKVFQHQGVDRALAYKSRSLAGRMAPRAPVMAACRSTTDREHAAATTGRNNMICPNHLQACKPVHVNSLKGDRFAAPCLPCNPPWFGKLNSQRLRCRVSLWRPADRCPADQIAWNRSSTFSPEGRLHAVKPRSIPGATVRQRGAEAVFRGRPVLRAAGLGGQFFHGIHLAACLPPEASHVRLRWAQLGGSRDQPRRQGGRGTDLRWRNQSRDAGPGNFTWTAGGPQIESFLLLNPAQCVLMTWPPCADSRENLRKMTAETAK